MTVAEILDELTLRGATLYVEAGRLKYAGPKRLPGDPIRAAIAEHRVELMASFARHVPDEHPAGWSDRLQREVLEPVPGRADQWQEPSASAALCIWCPSLLADGDLLRCEQHVAEHGVASPSETSWAMRRRAGRKERAA